MARKIITANVITVTDATTFTPVTHQGGDGRVSLAPATATTPGLMAAADKSALAEIRRKATGALVVSPNLFDKDDPRNQSGARVFQGDVQLAAGWTLSHPIELTAATEFFVTQANNTFFAFYDANGTVVAAPPRVASGSGSILTRPASAVTLRISFEAASNADINAAYVVEGTQPAEVYPPFGGLIGTSAIRDLGAASLADAAVTPEKTSFLTLGKNLFDVASVTAGVYINASGGAIPNATYVASDFIPVEAGETYIASTALRFRTAYGADRSVIASAGSNSNFTANTPWVIPAGVAYVRITVTPAQANILQFEKGAATTAYQPYRYEFSPLIHIAATTSSGNRPATFGLERLRETQARLRSLERGATGLEARLNMSLIGDSWTHSATRFTGKLSTLLWGKYLDGSIGPTGLGWIGFKGAGSGVLPNGAVYWNNYMTGGGTWSSANGDGFGPDICHEQSSQAGAWLQPAQDWNYGDGRAYSLIAQGGSGVVRYRWAATGDWITLDLSALHSGTQVIDLPTPPGNGSGRWRIEVVSGTCTLCGIYQRHPTDAGIIVNKLGATGTRLQQWASVNAAQWQTGFAALQSHLTVILHGTNDQTARGKAQFKDDLIIMIDRVRAASPASDILLVAPCENQRVNALAMSNYAEAMYEIARDDRDVAYIDLQPSFGAAPADYAFGSARPWFNSDGIHPNNGLGGTAIAGAILTAMGA